MTRSPTVAVPSQRYSELRFLPKIDLHRHLLGSARVATLWELCRQNGCAPGYAEFEAELVHRRPVGTLTEYIRPWSLMRHAIRDVADVERIAYEALVDAAAEGVQYVEFRKTPPGLLPAGSEQSSFDPFEYFKAVGAGFETAQRETGSVARLILDVSRHAVGPLAAQDFRRYGEGFLEVLDHFKGDLIVGAGVTGIEEGTALATFQELFAEIAALSVPAAVHAGEVEGPEQVREAVELLGARRIGHGTALADDADLLADVTAAGVAVEVCPTSTVVLGRAVDVAHHPVLGLLAAGQIGVLCTDNPTVCATDLTTEIALVADALGADPAEFAAEQHRRAGRAAFGPVN